MAAQQDQSTWRVLPLSGDASRLPPLVISTRFTASSYAIHLSDLTNIWSEILDRKGIIMRAFHEDTSIDPSDGNNMRALLDKLEDALDSSRVGNANVSLSIPPHDDSTTGDTYLLMTITYTFPTCANLSPLIWPMYLVKSPISTIRSEMFFPLLRTLHTSNLQIEMLLKELRDKDTVIAKFLAKMENLGLGLESVFSSLPVKKKVTFEAAQGRVRGLAPFSSSSLRMELIEGEDVGVVDTPEQLIHRVFGEGLRYKPVTLSAGLGETDEWWKTMGTVNFSSTYSPGDISHGLHTSFLKPTFEENDNSGTNIDDRDRKSMSQYKKRIPTPLAMELVSLSNEDDFQEQASPPRLTAKKKQNAENEPAEYHSHSLATRKKLDISSSSPDSFFNVPQKHRDTVRKQKAVAFRPSSPGLRSNPLSLMDDSETASSDISGDSVLKQTKSEDCGFSKRQGLGRVDMNIGESSTRFATSLNEMDDRSSSSPNQTNQSRPEKRRLGVIGNREVSKVNPQLSSRGRSSEMTAHREAPHETSEGKANRRRRELKQDISSGPASKKKRKF